MLVLKKNVSLCKIAMNFSRHTHKTSKLNWTEYGERFSEFSHFPSHCADAVCEERIHQCESLKRRIHSVRIHIRSMHWMDGCVRVCFCSCDGIYVAKLVSTELKCVGTIKRLFYWIWMLESDLAKIKWMKTGSKSTKTKRNGGGKARSDTAYILMNISRFQYEYVSVRERARVRVCACMCSLQIRDVNVFCFKRLYRHAVLAKMKWKMDDISSISSGTVKR